MTTDNRKQIRNSTETEYKKILDLWQIQSKYLSFGPSDFEQQDLLGLFYCFLNQVWSDAQQMSQNTWRKQEETSCTTMGLYWMKQAVVARQKVIDLMSSNNNVLNDSAATIQHGLVYPSFAKTSISSSASDTFRPTKIRSSPSTPTLSNFGSKCDDQAICMQSSQVETDHFATMSRKGLSCYHCHEKVGMKRSFSANDAYTFDHASNSSYHSAESSRRDDDSEVCDDDGNDISQPFSPCVCDKHTSYPYMNRQSMTNYNMSCYCYCYQSETDESNDGNDYDDTSISGSKLLLKKEDTVLDECYKEKLVKYMLIEQVDEADKDNQDCISLQPSSNSSCNNLGLPVDDITNQQKKDREELRRYICCEYNNLEIKDSCNSPLVSESQLIKPAILI
ncbi:hypothetical protein A0J61_00729 [Choanephora cucurbitarum]|uniref:Uncharacterized protein n=1 Tax=Choanephora cucurbitarum TaxID=101091 RepID=A0A1C7NQ35_9FUNG|nr:hypothetical protein A0J61_00729 [Choanephora cucurbitarum]